MSIAGGNDAGTTLITDIVEYSVNFQGKPSVRSSSGGWRSSGFIIGAEVAEKFACEENTVRIGIVFIAAAKNLRKSPSDTFLLQPLESSKKFRFLDRAVISCDSAEVEEAKAVLSLVPIWMCCLMFGIVYAQSATFLS